MVAEAIRNPAGTTPSPLVAETLSHRLQEVHRSLHHALPGIDRIAVALYDPWTDLLKTFAHSTQGGESPLDHYEIPLTQVPSLQALEQSRQNRVIDDLSLLDEKPSEHTRRILDGGYLSSFTHPIFEDGHLFGFLFFDSKERHYFTAHVLDTLSSHGDLIALLLVHSLLPARVLVSAVKVASALSHERNPETGAHLDRMAHYSRIIAHHLAREQDLDDDFVEYVFFFAPLHDIGKIAIPDRVLLKEGKLVGLELEEMRAHVTRGAAIVDQMVSELGLQDLPHIHVLRNIVLHHHEAIDGTGYPQGLSGLAIPLEARIVAVADVYDALTSDRPYKPAWSHAEALEFLRKQAGQKLDASCVEALAAESDAVVEILKRFS